MDDRNAQAGFAQPGGKAGLDSNIGRRRWRRGAIALGALASALVGTVLVSPQPWLVWNVSASAPVGLYAVGGRANIQRGDMVIAWVPGPWRQLAAERHYIPINVPLVKRVAGVPGDTVCEADRQIFINGRWAARRQSSDGRGRPIPAWRGCTVLGNGALFLLMVAPDSFDGRYFGPTRIGDVVGTARLLWAR